MDHKRITRTGAGLVLAALALGASAQTTTTVQIGASGKTYASSAARCTLDPATGASTPSVEAGLFNPKRSTSAQVLLDGALLAHVDVDRPSAVVPLVVSGTHKVAVVLNRRTADLYAFTVPAGMCSNLPDTSGNTFSADGALEYAASGKSYATVAPGCALNPATGQTQPFVNLFDNGGFLLNVSVNGKPLTQLSASRPRTPVFLGAGSNVISAANGSLSTDYYVRDGGTGLCVLP